MNHIHKTAGHSAGPARHAAEPKISKLGSTGDPAQHLTVHGNVIRITGRATDSGTKPSGWRLEIDGHPVSVSLKRDETPQKTAEAIKRALPKGYHGEVEIHAPARRPGGPIVEYARDRLPVTLTVTKKAAAHPPEPPQISPTDDMRAAVEGTVPTVVDKFVDQLKSPKVAISGIASGTMTFTYTVKDAASARSIGKDIKDGMASLGNNIAEGLNTADLVGDPTVKVSGRQVIVAVKWKKA